MPGIRVVTDSSSDLPPDLVSTFGIEIVPLTIRFGDEEFVDVRDLSPDQFWERCHKSARLPETAAPAPGAFREAFLGAAEDGMDGVVCITISSGLSATHQAASASLIGDDLPIPVSVIDSRYVTLAQGFVVLAAAEAAASGLPLDKVVDATREVIERVSAFATLDTLDNLRKGGRIGGAQALLGSMLAIKPVIQLVDGVVEPESRQRTRSKALTHLIEATKARGTPERLGIAHGAASDVGRYLDQVNDAFPGIDVVISEMGAVLGTHVGHGAVALVARLAP